MCKFNPKECNCDEYRKEIRKNVDTPAGFYDMEDTICVGCGSKSSKCIVPEPKVKRGKENEKNC